MSTRPLILYHANCPDGFGAAYAAWRKWGSAAEYFPAEHHRPPPSVVGRTVYLLDFCYSREQMLDLARSAAELHVVDHHASTVDWLRDFPEKLASCVLDLTHSGAWLAWKFFHPTKEVPQLIKHVQARDIWSWDMPQSRAFLAALDMLPFEFKAWDDVAKMSFTEYEDFVARGTAMSDKFEALAQAHVIDACPIQVDGLPGLTVAANRMFTSRVGSLLAEKCGTFGLLWSLAPDRTLRLGLRSVEGFDVRILAERFGGGGHSQSAGFGLPADRIKDIIEGSLCSPEFLRATDVLKPTGCP